MRGKFSKNDVLVDFPVNDILDADEVFYSAGESKGKKKGVYFNSKYELSSVLYHQGNANGGHYFTRRKNLNGEWVKYDD